MTVPGACVVGAGQVTVRSPADVLDLWAEAVDRALADTGAPRIRRAVAGLAVVECGDPAPLAERLGVRPRWLVGSVSGGVQPQRLLHAAAAACARGDLDVAVVVSGQGRAGPAVEPSPSAADLAPWFHPGELRHGMLPILRSFALRDSARRAHLGTPVDVYAREPGPVWAAMSRVAAANPHAWHREARTPAEILTPSPGNRMPVHPYTKLLVASPFVDQAAAVVVAGAAAADRLGVPPDRRVHVRGCGAAADHPYVAHNEDLWRSPGMAAATDAALGAAGVGIDDVELLDLYSCFPSAVRFALDALGLALDDRRGVTVTGGMPYAGAPGSGYVTHALATMVAELRERPGALGLATGLTGQMADHTATVLSAAPGRAAPPPRPPRRRRRHPLRIRGRGPAVVEAYAVACDRAGRDEAAVAVCRLGDGSRCYAWSDDAALLAWLVRCEGVGRRVELVGDPGGRNRMVA